MINNKLKTSLLLIALAVPMTLSACKGSASQVDNEKKILTEGDWTYYNAITGEEEGITFNKDNEYFYSCSCGEPVGNSDAYDIYSYDGDGKITIKASYEDGPEDVTLKILHIDDRSLLLDMGDDIVEFYNADKSTNCLAIGYEDNCDDCLAYFEGYDAYSTILDINGDSVELAPADYDGDTDDLFKDYKRNVKLAKDVEIFELSAYSEYNGEERTKHECPYKELTKEELTNMLEYGNGSVLLWYNSDGEITKMISYGSTIIWK